MSKHPNRANRRLASNRAGVAVWAVLAAAVALEAQVVYVKCCMDQTKALSGFGPCMTGPIGNPSWADDGYSCIWGFGPDRTWERMGDMCRSFELPDQSNSVCTEWEDESIEAVEWCRGPRYLYGMCKQLFDYDGDNDIDLVDCAAHQIYVGSVERTDGRNGSVQCGRRKPASSRDADGTAP